MSEAGSFACCVSLDGIGCWVCMDDGGCCACFDCGSSVPWTSSQCLNTCSSQTHMTLNFGLACTHACMLCPRHYAMKLGTAWLRFLVPDCTYLLHAVLTAPVVRICWRGCMPHLALSTQRAHPTHSPRKGRQTHALSHAVQSSVCHPVCIFAGRHNVPSHRCPADKMPVLVSFHCRSCCRIDQDPCSSR